MELLREKKKGRTLNRPSLSHTRSLNKKVNHEQDQYNRIRISRLSPELGTEAHRYILFTDQFCGVHFISPAGPAVMAKMTPAL
jgi:hypothetical protein